MTTILMKSDKGNYVPNQVIVESGTEWSRFFSYGVLIVEVKSVEGGEQVYLDICNWKYSRTTIKYRNKFLGEDSKTIESKVKSNEYKLADLKRKSRNTFGAYRS